MTHAIGTAGRLLLAFAHAGDERADPGARSLLDLISGLDRGHFEALVLASAPTLLRECEREGAETVRVRRWRGGMLLGAPWRAQVGRVLRASQPSLLHVAHPDALPMLAPIARRLAIPVLVHLHVPFSSLGARCQALAREAAVVVSAAEHLIAPLRGDGAVRDRLQVIHPAVNADELAPLASGDLRTTLGIPPGAFVATSIGSAARRDAHDVTIRAVVRARERGLDVHLLLAGEGADAKPLRKLASSMGVAAMVHFLGARHDTGGILRDATDVLVSSAHETSVPAGVLAGQWLGIPVIASDTAAHREAVGEDRGVLVPVGDAAALATAMIELADSPARRVALGKVAMVHAHARHDMARFIAEFDALYRETIVNALS